MKYKNDFVVIRPSKKDDIEAILAIAEQDAKFLALNKGNKRRRLTSHCGSKKNHIVVAEANGEVIGAVHKSDLKKNKAIIEEIMVDRKARGCKIATLLLLWYITETNLSGFKAKTFSTNKAVHKLNSKIGMEIIQKSPKEQIWYWESDITPRKGLIITDCHVNICPEELLIDKKDIKLGVATDFSIYNSAKNALNVMNICGIKSAVIFPFPFRNLNINLANQYVLEMSQNYPDRFIPVGLINSSVKKWIKAGMKGFKENSYYMDIDRYTYLKEYKMLADNGLPLLLHPHKNNKADRIIFTLERVPTLKIILCHSGRKKVFSGEEVLEVARQLSNYEKVFFDTSTVWDTGTLKELIDIVGINRVIFGSDYPFALIDKKQDRVVERELAFVRSIGLNVKEANIILGLTTRKLFNS